MPTNLNALLRYKIIDECLSNPQLICTIEVLMDKCAEKLSEHQGINSISERTIRNDIRILRSDALGFNSPIVINQGVYTYSESSYSLFGRPIKELDLLKDIQSLQVAEFDAIQNENLPYLLIQLAHLTAQKIPRRCAPEGYEILESKKLMANVKVNHYKSNMESYVYSLWKTNKPYRWFEKPFKKPKEHIYFKWEYVFEAL
ncbi:hypothetical protein [Flavobacterium nackdongense]|uniref:WYL domain-containing protein n=1 Tax=Flavobacterium nackdongense TaxID=2547394 RepID=A0A4P6Y9Q9_9FLAO|nr:hypothetical protein [Flavobacterium nackdongense]QBN19746.1 hypothetical protein E1750_13350 [Flavobacterium nackdongense]